MFKVKSFIIEFHSFFRYFSKFGNKLQVFKVKSFIIEFHSFFRCFSKFGNKLQVFRLLSLFQLLTTQHNLARLTSKCIFF